MFNDADAGPHLSRSDDFGFRVVNVDGEVPAAAAPIEWPYRDFNKEKPVPDAVFSAFQGIYTYDRTALDAVVDSPDDSDERWRKEKITFNTAYGGERMFTDLFVPGTGHAPFPTVVLFPS